MSTLVLRCPCPPQDPRLHRSICGQRDCRICGTCNVYACPTTELNWYARPKSELASKARRKPGEMSLLASLADLSPPSRELELGTQQRRKRMPNKAALTMGRGGAIEDDGHLRQRASAFYGNRAPHSFGLMEVSTSRTERADPMPIYSPTNELVNDLYACRRQLQVRRRARWSRPWSRP